MEIVKSSKLIQSIIHVFNWTKNSRIINYIGASLKSSKALTYLFAERHTFAKFIENSKILGFNKPMEKHINNNKGSDINWNSSFSKENATLSNKKSTKVALTNGIKSSYLLTLICSWKDCEEDDKNT